MARCVQDADGRSWRQERKQRSAIVVMSIVSGPGLASLAEILAPQGPGWWITVEM